MKLIIAELTDEEYKGLHDILDHADGGADFISNIWEIQKKLRV